jgi:hypothetical protein
MPTTRPLAQSTALAAAIAGYFRGLTIANNASLPNTRVDIAPGVAQADDGLTQLVLASTITKALDATFVLGTGNGGLDTGSKAINTTYHLWLIRRTSDGLIDALFSTSATAPTMPGGWLAKRYLWPVLTDGSGNIRGFVQLGPEFLWSAGPVTDVSATTPGTAAVLRALTVPTGIKVRALINALTVSLTGVTGRTTITSPDAADVVGVGAYNAGTYAGAGATNVQDATQMSVRTNTSGQIRTRMDAAATGDQLYIGTAGFLFPREAY